MSSQNDILSQSKLSMIVSGIHELRAGIDSLNRVAESEQIFESLLHEIKLAYPRLDALLLLARTIRLSNDNQSREKMYPELLSGFRSILAEVIITVESIVKLSTASSSNDVLRLAKILDQCARELVQDFEQSSFDHLYDY